MKLCTSLALSAVLSTTSALKTPGSTGWDKVRSKQSEAILSKLKDIAEGGPPANTQKNGKKACQVGMAGCDKCQGDWFTEDGPHQYQGKSCTEMACKGSGWDQWYGQYCCETCSK